MGKSGPRPSQSAAVNAATTELRELIATARGMQGDFLATVRELQAVTIPQAAEAATIAAVHHRLSLMEAELKEGMASYQRQIVDAFEILVHKLTGGVSASQLIEMTSIEVTGPEMVDMLREIMNAGRTETDEATGKPRRT